MDWFGPTGKISKKAVHLSRWTSLFGWTGPIEMVCSIWPFRPILNSRTSLFRIFHVQNGGKYLSLRFHWIVNSGSISVHRTSMYTYNRSVVASQASVRFGCWRLLKTIYFLKEFEMFFSSFDSKTSISLRTCVWSHMDNIWERCAQNNPLFWLNYYEWSSSHNIINITVEIVI